FDGLPFETAIPPELDARKPAGAGLAADPARRHGQELGHLLGGEQPPVSGRDAHASGSDVLPPAPGRAQPRRASPDRHPAARLRRVPRSRPPPRRPSASARRIGGTDGWRKSVGVRSVPFRPPSTPIGGTAGTARGWREPVGKVAESQFTRRPSRG